MGSEFMEDQHLSDLEHSFREFKEDVAKCASATGSTELWLKYSSNEIVNTKS